MLDAAGKAVAGARVYLVRAPGAAPDIAALTGADGRFSLSAARPGLYEIACSTDTLGSVANSIEVGTGGAVVELRLGKA